MMPRRFHALTLFAVARRLLPADRDGH